MILRYVFIGESAMWAARANRFEVACQILKKRHGIDAVVAQSVTAEAESSVKMHGAYSVLFNRKYRQRTILGCVVATMQAWQYNAVGVLSAAHVGRYPGRRADQRAVRIGGGERAVRRHRAARSAR